MAAGDIQFYDISTTQQNGAKRYNVAAGVTILAGEPVIRTAGVTTVIPVTGTMPNATVAGEKIVGIAATNSTATASAAGTVDIFQCQPGVIYLIKPKVPANWDTQAEYDALVGKRVLIDLTSGSYTLTSTDNADFGCVVMAMDVARYPGRVAFSFRNSVMDLNA